MKVRRAVLVFVLAVTLSAAVAAQSTPLLDIPAGKLNTALEALARQTKVELIYSASDLEGLKTRGVHGALTIEKAIAELLAGTDLTVTTHPSGALLIGRKPTTDSGPPQPLARQSPPQKTPRVEHDRSSDRDDDATSEIVIAGYRESLAEAQKLKRDAVIDEDVIVAEDIAAFPDLNLAESLQRIPGVTIDRDSGEGRQITLRGLGPDFTRAQLNGMEVLGNTASGMDNRGGGVSRTRSFDYSLLASELFDRVTVQKSYEAAQDEGGIGGTIELSTAKPFDYVGFKAVLSSKGQTNSVTHTVSPRIVGLISDRWDNHFGALASVSYSINDSNEFGYRNWGWSQIKVGPGNIGPGVSAADATLLESGTVYAPQADTYSTWYDHRTRTGGTLSLQYEPDYTLKFGLDNLFSRLTNQRSDYALAAAGVNALTGNISGTQILQSAAIRGNTLLAAQYTGVDMRSEFNTESDRTDFYQTVLHGSDQVTDDLLVDGLVGY
jgi:TonB-dependent receptor